MDSWDHSLNWELLHYRQSAPLCFNFQVQLQFILRLLEMCSVDNLSVCIDIPDSTSLAMLTREVNDETEEKPWQSTDCGMWKTWRDQPQLGSLQEIRLSGFMGTDREMEVADLLFGVRASRPALERISISLFPQSVDGSLACEVGTWLNFKGMPVSFARVLQHMDAIGAKMKAEFPLVEGRWETVPRKEITWTRT